MWERGLKLLYRKLALLQNNVAPHVGAWIETQITIYNHISGMSLPMWERGLKPQEDIIRVYSVVSLPMWERGLKLC